MEFLLNGFGLFLWQTKHTIVQPLLYFWTIDELPKLCILNSFCFSAEIPKSKSQNCLWICSFGYSWYHNAFNNLIYSRKRGRRLRYSWYFDQYQHCNSWNIQCICARRCIRICFYVFTLNDGGCYVRSGDVRSGLQFYLINLPYYTPCIHRGFKR